MYKSFLLLDSICLSVITLTLFIEDINYFKLSQKNISESYTEDTISFGILGIIAFCWPLVITIHKYIKNFKQHKYNNNRKIILFLFMFYTSLLLTISFSESLKIIIYKERPDFQLRNALDVNIKKDGLKSFPSGHSAVSTSLFFPTMYYLKNQYNSIILMILGGIVSGIFSLAIMYSRIYDNKHDIIDVTAGFILGIICSFIAIYIAACKLKHIKK
ncbi:hypothetical protein EBI_27172 [Enterocytozoon bieneusi H348]|nr:hypothetical protein EBI_27172 [Enterocytozoon bieneusi H348]|eukprot:XP_002649927.1 hypothetical protein EBI_27172 [Enterocytozoon bieneusi H348]